MLRPSRKPAASSTTDAATASASRVGVTPPAAGTRSSVSANARVASAAVTPWAPRANAASSALSARMLMRRVRPPESRAMRVTEAASNTFGPR